jgi:hypothetical protein
MIRTVKELKEALSEWDDDALVSILFECSEARPDGFQYDVPVLALAGTKDHVRICHEEDYPEHYSKLK